MAVLQLGAFLFVQPCRADLGRPVRATYLAVIGILLCLCVGWAQAKSPGQAEEACVVLMSGVGSVAPDTAGYGAIECEQYAEVNVLTDEGVKPLRLHHARNFEEVVGPMLLREFEQAMRAIPGTIHQIGPFRLHPVRILVTADPLGTVWARETPDILDVGRGNGSSSVHGHAHADRPAEQFTDILGSAALIDGQCRVHLHVLTPDARVETAAPVLLHEVFHCVQLATLGEDLARLSANGQNSGAKWWIEGSAEWFGALAWRGADVLQQRLARFDRLSATTPLHEMSYEAVVFFLWLGATRQPEAILTFLKQMAAQPDATAQRAAMVNALRLEDWLDFAKYYLEGRIAHPQGTPIACNPAAGGSGLDLDQGGTLELEPFVLYRGWYEMACSTKSNVAKDGGGGIKRPRSWLNDDVTEVRTQFRFLSLAAAANRVSLPLESTLLNACRPCEAAAAIDACLVGVAF